MSYKVVEKKQGQVKFEIEAEAAKIKKATDMVAEELGKSVKVSGFRPGKAPIFMIEKEVGKDKFWAEVMDRLIPEVYYEAVVKEGISPISMPQIQVKEFIPGEKLVFEATVAILPEIKDLKYKDLKLKFEPKKPTVEEEKNAYKGLLSKYATEKEVVRASKNGDRVEIDFEGTMKGLPFDGGSSKNHPLVLGSKMMIPGFEEAIIGKKAGEEFDFDITFPKDYQAANLAGQKVNFKVKLNKVFEKEPPKEDDAWAKSLGLESLTKLKEELKKQLAFEKELHERRQKEDELVQKIVEKNKIEAPEALVEEEIHRMIHEAEHNLSHSGLTMEKFLEMSKKTLADLEKEMKPEAEKRVKVGIVIGEIARTEKISIGDKDVDIEIEKIIAMADPSVSKDDVRSAYDTPERRREIGNNLIIKKVIDKIWVLNIAS